MDLGKIVLLALLGCASLGTVVFVVAKILETVEQIKFTRYLASDAANKDKMIAVLPDDNITGDILKFKNMSLIKDNVYHRTDEIIINMDNIE